MKLFFDHVLGKQKNEDFVFSLVSATFEEDEWDSAIENGWAPTCNWFDSNFSKDHSLIWYNCRQSRIEVNKYVPNSKTKKLVNNLPVQFVLSTDVLTNLETVQKIYSKYCTYKNFGDPLSIEDIDSLLFKALSSKNYYLYFFNEKEELVAITKLSLWSNSLLSEIFWWDYENPDLSLGKVSFYLEIELAKKLGLKYLYTGISYNSDSIYKSTKKGFQFWTGREWSSDINLFKELCVADDKIESIIDLHNYQYKYLGKLNV